MLVSEEFVEFLSEGAVAIEVYGHKQANPRRNLALWDLGVIQAKTRSLRERLHFHFKITLPSIKADSGGDMNGSSGRVCPP